MIDNRIVQYNNEKMGLTQIDFVLILLSMKFSLFSSLFTTVLSILSILGKQILFESSIYTVFDESVGFILLGVIVIEITYEFIKASSKLRYFKQNLLTNILAVIFLLLILINNCFKKSLLASDLSLFVVLFRNVALILQIYSKGKKFKKFIMDFTSNPAKVTLLSFVLVILVGALFLMMGFTANSGKGLSLINALFTSTSCVCVTGLVVVDTVTYFSIYGQIIIMCLIQIGGLGIMVLSFFTIYVMNKRVSLTDKMLLSYMLSEDDANNLQKALISIVLTTLIIELVGAVFLLIGFIPKMGFSIKTVFYAIFHSISAFCNGGFALFSDSMESFRHSPLITLTISFLIILGGIGFTLIVFGSQTIKQKVLGLIRKTKTPKVRLSANSYLVLKYSAILLIIGTFLFYILEHTNTMSSYDLGEQYLAAFFQSVTFRTAGFNSVPLNNLTSATIFVVCFFMFVGAASGSTAGGIKVNTLAVIVATIKSYIKGEKTVKCKKFEIPSYKIRQSFLILSSGVSIVFISTFLLLLTEKFDFERVLFEVVSAIGTVGVSTGITADLSIFGKVVIMLLMFWGRIGVLTIMSAAHSEEESVKIRLPHADISIG